MNSISTFNQHLSVLERTSPDRSGFSTVGARPANTLRDRSSEAPVIGSMIAVARGSQGPTLTLSEAQRRRRVVLTGLAGATAVSLLLALVIGGIFVVLAAVVTLALVAYGGLLAYTRQLAVERAEKVHYLPHAAAAADPWADQGEAAYGDLSYGDLSYGEAAYGEAAYGEAAYGDLSYGEAAYGEAFAYEPGPAYVSSAN